MVVGGVGFVVDFACCHRLNLLMMIGFEGGLERMVEEHRANRSTIVPFLDIRWSVPSELLVRSSR